MGRAGEEGWAQGVVKNNWGCLLESATERGGFKVRFSVETGAWWFGGGGGGGSWEEKIERRSSNCQLCSEREREQECGSARE